MCEELEMRRHEVEALRTQIHEAKLSLCDALHSTSTTLEDMIKEATAYIKYAKDKLDKPRARPYFQI
jgi:hypothetical protein